MFDSSVFTPASAPICNAIGALTGPVVASAKRAARIGVKPTPWGPRLVKGVIFPLLATNILPQRMSVTTRFAKSVVRVA
jgi:hypothetical protein